MNRSEQKPVMKKLTNLSFFYTLIAMLVLFVGSSILSPSFRPVRNLLTILCQG